MLWYCYRYIVAPGALLPSSVDILRSRCCLRSFAHLPGIKRGTCSSQRVSMLIARALLAKIRPPPLNPREIQNQVDVSRAAGLTAAYAAQQQQDGEWSCSFDQLEKEIAALKPLERKRRVQTAINDQVSLEPISAAVAKPTVTPTCESPQNPHVVGTVLSGAFPLIGGPHCCFLLFSGDGSS